MGPTAVYWIAATLLCLSPAAAESPPALTCDVAKQPDGLISYKLSRPPSSPSCTPNWETVNKTVIVSEAKRFDSRLVQNVTEQSVFLKECHDHLHYRENCEGVFMEAHCQVNCSHLSDSGVHPTALNSTCVNCTLDVPILVNATWICIFGTWCLKPWAVALCITIIFVLVVVFFGGLYFWKLFKRRRGNSASADEQMLELEQQKALVS